MEQSCNVKKWVIGMGGKKKATCRDGTAKIGMGFTPAAELDVSLDLSLNFGGSEPGGWIYIGRVY